MLFLIDDDNQHPVFYITIKIAYYCTKYYVTTGMKQKRMVFKKNQKKTNLFNTENTVKSQSTGARRETDFSFQEKAGNQSCSLCCRDASENL